MSKPVLRTITIEELDGFKIDQHDKLYWHSDRVRTLIDLPDWSKWAAIAAAIATCVSAATQVIRLIHGT